MRRFFLPLFALALSVFGASFASSDASAVPAPAVQTTDTLSLISADGLFNVSYAEDEDFDWYDLVMSGNQPYNDARCSSTFRDSLTIAYNSKTYLAVTQVAPNQTGNGGWGITVHWSATDVNSEVFQYPSPNETYVALRYPDNNTSKIVIERKDNGEFYWGCSNNMTEFSATSSSVISGIANDRYLYYSTYSITYPTEYEGGTLPAEPNAPEKEIRRPHFSYQQNNLAITALPYAPDPALPDFTSELDEGYFLEGYYIGWNLWACPDGGFDPVTQVCTGGTPTLADSDTIPVGESYSATVEEYGTYKLEAEYWAQSCYRYPSYPATPDYCFYSQLRAHFESALFDYVNTYVVLTVDGRQSSGDTAGLVCNEGGFCQEQEAICFEQTTFIDQLNCELKGSLGVGLLNPSIQAFKSLFTATMVSATPVCNVPLTDITIGGQVFPLSGASDKMCNSAQVVRDGFPIITVVVNALFALAILGFIINRVNRLLDNQQHDVLEKI